MNKANLLKLADVLESEQAEKHFYMGTWMVHYLNYDRDNYSEEEYNKAWEHHCEVLQADRATAINDCGTVACIAGWAATLANPKQAMEETDAIERDAAKWLGLDARTTDMLFCPWNTTEFGNQPGIREIIHLRNPKAAAKVVRHFAETGEIDWSLAFEEEEEQTNER